MSIPWIKNIKNVFLVLLVCKLPRKVTIRGYENQRIRNLSKRGYKNRQILQERIV